MHVIDRLNYAKIWSAPIKVWGQTMRAPSADRLLALMLHSTGLMGKKEAEFFRSWVRPGMRVVDVGANQGIYSLYFSSLVGQKGKVWAFEPEPRLYESLTKNCGANHSGVETFKYALGQEYKTLTLHRSLINSGDNRLNSSLVLSEGVPVEMVRLDKMLEGKSVDFMKIDVQGHELDVLKGSEGLLTANPQLVVYFELWPYGLKKAGTKAEEIFDFFYSRGYQLSCANDGFQNPIQNFSDILSRLRGKKYDNLLARKIGTSN